MLCKRVAIESIANVFLWICKTFYSNSLTQHFWTNGMLQFVFFTSAKLLADTLKRRCTKYPEYRMSDLPKCWNKIRIGRRFVTPQFQDPNYNGIQFFSIDSDTYGCSCSLFVFCCIFLLWPFGCLTGS